MAGAKIGDIIEFKLASGKLTYAQYTHRHEGEPSYGQLLRVLPGIYETRPEDLAALAHERGRFYAFLPMDYCLRRGDLRIVGNVAIPESARRFPRFKEVRGIDPRTNRATHWSVWDGGRSTPIETMTPEIAGLSELGLPTLQFVVSRIESGYKPEDDV